MMPWVSHNLEVSKNTESKKEKNLIPKLSLLTLIASSGAEKYSTKKPNRDYSYGNLYTTIQYMLLIKWDPFNQ